VARALIGHTGFVGGNLLRQTSFDECYNSTNVEEIAGRRFDLLVVSGAPAAKWLANREPERDLAGITRLEICLDNTAADEVVLISTVDVYPQPVGVDEAVVIDPTHGQPYGRHRLALEDFVRRRFERTLTVRLPGLFGEGLKKNAIYDFLHENATQQIHADSVFQFYDLANLWRDVSRFREAGLDLVNVATEPMTVAEMARDGLGIEFANRPASLTPIRYDFRTRHNRLLGGAGGYLYDRRHVVAELKAFAERERGRPR